ncbi:MAG TPA: hypothetical protein DCP08_01955 [Chloroflexi bacterium]|nr:hypothetical protein [Chloroflexota bacterium]
MQCGAVTCALAANVSRSARQALRGHRPHRVGVATQLRLSLRGSEGQVNWRRVVKAFVTVGYDYVLSCECEDPVMSREDGVEQCIEYGD